MNIIELAREAGLNMPDRRNDLWMPQFERFAALVRAEALADFGMKECRHCGFLCKPNPDESKPWYPLAGPVKQEPVAWGCVIDGELVDFVPTEQKDINCNAGHYETPLYAAPIDAKAIQIDVDTDRIIKSDPLYLQGRAEALEEAAKVCELFGTDWVAVKCVEEIRGLK